MNYTKNLFQTLAISFGLVFTLILATLTISWLSTTSRADLLELNEMTLSYHTIFQGSRDPLLTSWNQTPQNRIELYFNVDVLKFFYWDNNIHTTTDLSQFRVVGWEFHYGIRATDWLQIGLYHHSQHILDGVYPFDRFPVEDSLEIQINIFNKNKNRATLF